MYTDTWMSRWKSRCIRMVTPMGTFAFHGVSHMVNHNLRKEKEKIPEVNNLKL